MVRPLERELDETFAFLCPAPTAATEAAAASISAAAKEAPQ